MIQVDDETVDVGSQVEAKIARGEIGAINQRRIPAKQTKRLSDFIGSMTLALFRGSNSESSVWMWGGIEVVRKEPLTSFKLISSRNFDEAQHVYDSMKKPKDVWEYLKRNGWKIPDHVKLE